MPAQQILSLQAFPVKLARDHAQAQGTAGSPHALSGDSAYAWSLHYPALYSRHFESCLVRVELSDGRVGWGEAQAPLAPEVPAEIVHRLLAPVLVGEDFDGSRARIAELWQRMYSTMRVRGQSGGFMLDAIAGVDIALWNLCAQPLPTAGAVEAYVSGVPGQNLADRLAFVDRHWRAGFRTFKLYFESDWQDLLATLDALSSHFPGIRLAVDALWHLPSTDCARDLAERGILWLECPLVPEDLDAHVRLVEETGVRLALGESYRTRWEAKPFFERDIVTYWQPDLGRSGITETLALSELAAAHGAAIVPHISIALPPQLKAALESAFAIPNCRLCEYNPSVVELANRFAASPCRLENGAYVSAPGALSSAPPYSAP